MQPSTALQSTAVATDAVATVAAVAADDIADAAPVADGADFVAVAADVPSSLACALSFSAISVLASTSLALIALLVSAPATTLASFAGWALATVSTGSYPLLAYARQSHSRHELGQCTW